ncbi:MAG: aminotransferase class I/II-fold pyridoxal phosphate-dependent enzyme [Acidobacteriia bacterium]|nr:aminotransferase class I/II-fold pyridoxal phosphate-dependent enzyme [Terriglobia bacterium]
MLQMAPETMRELAHHVADLLIERNVRLRGERAWEGDFKDALADRLDEDPPEAGRPAREVIDRAARDVLNNTLRLDHPRSFGFVPACPTWPGVLADFIASGFNVNAATWLVASGPSQLESVVIGWFRQWFGLPDGAGGLMTSGGSAAALHGLVAAREAAGNPDRAVAYMSDQSHGAQVRAARIVGITPDRIRVLPTDTSGRVDPGAVAEAVAADRAAGRTPMVVCANAGTPTRGAVDPLPALADICAAERMWLHVDAAYGGFAILTPRGAAALEGIDRADSINVDPHKWLFQPYEAGCILVRDAGALERAFAIQHDVLQDSVWGAAHANLADQGIQLSRSFRALKVWMSIQTFGMAAFRAAIENGLDLAARAAEYAGGSRTLELLSASLGMVCFRVNPGGLSEDALARLNRKVLAHVFWGEQAFLSSTMVNRRFVLRLCILNHNTTWDDVRETLEAVERFATEVTE